MQHDCAATEPTSDAATDLGRLRTRACDRHRPSCRLFASRDNFIALPNWAVVIKAAPQRSAAGPEPGWSRSRPALVARPNADSGTHLVTPRLQNSREISPGRRKSAIITVVINSYPVASLLLDETNPRFVEAVESQRAAVNALLADGPVKLLSLAEDIAREDAINPTELPVLIEEDGELIVIEGNRRMAALKLLRNPELADDATHQRRCPFTGAVD